MQSVLIISCVICKVGAGGSTGRLGVGVFEVGRAILQLDARTRQLSGVRRVWVADRQHGFGPVLPDYFVLDLVAGILLEPESRSRPSNLVFSVIKTARCQDSSVIKTRG